MSFVHSLQSQSPRSPCALFQFFDWQSGQNCCDPCNLGGKTPFERSPAALKLCKPQPPVSLHPPLNLSLHAPLQWVSVVKRCVQSQRVHGSAVPTVFHVFMFSGDPSVTLSQSDGDVSHPTGDVSHPTGDVGHPSVTHVQSWDVRHPGT